MSNKEKHISFKKELLSQETSHAFAAFTWKVIEPLLNPDASDETLENLRILDQILPHSSVIAVGFHPGKKEAIAIPIALRAHLPNLKRIIGPIAADQHHRPLTQAWELLAASLYTTHFMPTVRKGNPKDQKHAKHTDAYSSSIAHHTKNHLAVPGNIYGITPGGTRSRTLQPLEEINKSFVRRALNRTGNIPYFAMAGFEHQGRYHVRVSRPILLSEIPQEGTISQKAEGNALLVMRHLAGLLPADMRGPYNQILK